MEVSGLLNTSVALTQEKYFPVPIEQEAVKATGQVRMRWGKKKSLALAGNRAKIPRSSRP
jgi:hypothetical protein